MLALAFIDFRILRLWAYPLFIASIGVLVALLFVGSGNGVARWISIGGFTFQPSEPAKIALILALAKYFNDLQP
jgi:rod shape determining protein RodA